MRNAGTLIIVLLGLLCAPAAAKADVVWLCEPGMARNPCAIPLDTTLQPATADTPQPSAREIDCFYVYPTVSNQLSANADRSRDPELESIAKYQAARFDQHCRVFAPIYRQSTLASIATGYASASGADRELAYADVLEAWRQYLAQNNGGRGVVLIGHSQGTAMLRRLLAEEIEMDPEQHARVVSALLVGGNVQVAAGEVAGGDFQRTPLCVEPGQTGCVVAFSTYQHDPGDRARFGRAPAPDREVACTDPRPLAGWDGPFRMLVPTEPFAQGPIAWGMLITWGGPAPTAATTWVSPPDRWDGGCRMIDGAHVLRMEPLPGSRRLNWYPEPNWGTHLVDVNVALDPLVDLVGRQAVAWNSTPGATAATPAAPRLRVR